MAESPEKDEMNTIFFTNLQLLGLDVVDMEGTYKIQFNKDMFNLPNKAGSEVVLNFLFEKLNPTLCREQFRDCWPVIDRKTELQFRKVCATWLSSIQKDDAESHMPHVSTTLLLSPGGRKFIHLLYSFSTYVLTQVMKSEHGWNAQFSINYPAILPRTEALGTLVTSAIQDSLVREKNEFFEQLLLTVTANRKWKDYSNELVKDHRGLTKSNRELQLEKRQKVNVLADSSVKQGLPLPAKRTVTMFDSDQDTFSAHRRQRIKKAKSQWKTLTKFNDLVTKDREIFQSILDSSTTKHIIDGAEMGVRVPGLLLRECSKEIQKREIDNVYNGGVLNLVSLVQLWNICLNLYKEQLESETLPSVSPEVPIINKQVHKYHSHLRHTQELREKLSKQTLPKLMHTIMQLQKKLNNQSVSEKGCDKNTNLLGLNLTAPTPPLMTVTRNSVNVEETPPGPVAGTAIYRSTPDALENVTSKIEMSIQKDAEVSKVMRDVPALTRLMNVQNRSVSQSRTNVPVSKSRSKEEAVKPGKAGGSIKSINGSTKPLSFKRSIQAGPAVLPENAQNQVNNVVAATPRTSKQKAVDMLADTIVDSVLNSTDSTVLSDMSAEALFEFGDLGFEAFDTKSLINRSPVNSRQFFQNLEMQSASGGARPKTFAADQRKTDGLYGQNYNYSRNTPELSVYHESVFSQNSKNTDSSCDSDSDWSNNAAVNHSGLLPNKSSFGKHSSFNESSTDLYMTHKLSKTPKADKSGLSTTSLGKALRSAKKESYEGDKSVLLGSFSNDWNILNSLGVVDKHSATHCENGKEQKSQAPLIKKSFVNEGLSTVNSNLTLTTSNSPDLLLTYTKTPNAYHSSSNSSIPRKTSYDVTPGVKSLHNNKKSSDHPEVSRRLPGDGQDTSDQTVLQVPLVFGGEDNEVDTEDTLDLRLNSLSPLSPEQISLSTSDLLTTVYNRINNGHIYFEGTDVSDTDHGKVYTDSVTTKMKMQSQNGSEFAHEKLLSERLSHEQSIPNVSNDVSTVRDFSKAGEKLIDFEDTHLPALVSLDSDDEELESEQDLGDSFIPSKQGIYLDSRSPAKHSLTPSRASSQPPSRANNSKLSSSNVKPSLTSYPEDNLQAKLALLQQKALDILNKSSEECQGIEDTYVAELEKINMTTTNPSKDAGDVNADNDEHDDDILSTEILNTDLLGSIEDLLS